MNREQWLEMVMEAARPMFVANGAEVPEAVRAAMCPPHRKMKAIGLCWSADSVADKGREIWISAILDDPMEIAATLVHEMCHAALPHDVGHKKPFVKLARSMKLAGKATATVASEEFKTEWQPILEKIGPLPGAKFQGTIVTYKPQKTPKMKNVTCPDCGFFARIRCDQVEMGRLTCPVDEGQVLMMKEEGGE